MKYFIFSFFSMWYLLSANTTFAFTHADTLRGSNGRGRNWWDVKQYTLYTQFQLATEAISGENKITFSITATPADSMQIDLQQPLVLDSVEMDNKNMEIVQEGNVWWIKYPFHTLAPGGTYTITAYYHGQPRKAIRPPWDGGFSYTTDANGKPWIAVSCQGLGASVWWPCKDAQWDEPDSGMDMQLHVPDSLEAVSNGRLTRTVQIDGGEKVVMWHVANPINNYDVTFYIGDYIHWSDTMAGEKGTLDLDFWVLRENESKARKHFAVVKPMLHCFEYWMGPYPFYEDGYKLVEAPYLGMEHQSAVAYGNEYKMGYKGTDRSQTGIGLLFDYLIVHETGHEWFGNNVTARDMADNWIHEGITTYSEALFVDCMLGKDDAAKYCRGEWQNIMNAKPIIGPYGVNEEGAGDMYDKGAAMMHMIRTLTGDDEKFRQMLRGLGREFYHKVITTAQAEEYIATHTGLDLTAFFNQYLRRATVPQLEYYIKKGQLFYKFNDIADGFSLPLTIMGTGDTADIKPTAEWQHIKWKGGFTVTFSNDFLFTVKP